MQTTRLSVDLPIGTYDKFRVKCAVVGKKHVEVIRELVGIWINVGSCAVGSWMHGN